MDLVKCSELLRGLDERMRRSLQVGVWDTVNQQWQSDSGGDFATMMTFTLLKTRRISQEDPELFSPLKPRLIFFTSSFFFFTEEPETMIESHTR